MISIAMATYNGEKFLQTQLDSILNQTMIPTELVIVDDNSSDRTWQIVCEFAKTAPFKVVKLRNENNLGYAKNFSIALSKCTSDIVFFCDQDDQWDLNKLQQVNAYLLQHPNIDVVIHDLAYCDGNLAPTSETKIKRLNRFHNLSRDYVTGMASAVNRKFLSICLPIPDHCVSHDAWVHLCAYYVKRKSILPDVLALYRRHDNNATTGLIINQPNKLRWTKVFFNLVHEKVSLDFNQSIERHALLVAWLNCHKQVLKAEFGVSRWLIRKSIAQLNIKILILRLIHQVGSFMPSTK